MGFPSEGKDPLPYLSKHNTKPIKLKHNLQRVGRGYLLGPIQDKSVRVTMKILSCQMFHKIIPMQCSIAVVEIVDLCALGEKFNWSLYLLNTLIKDAMLAQHKEDHKFHYSWLLILISSTVWTDPPYYVQMDVPLSCLGARY